MPETTLAVLNANIITLNPKHPRAEAVYIQNGRITTVGSNKEIRRHITRKTKVIDAKDKTIIPGLIDCHVHMTGFGFSLQSLNLTNAKSIRQMKQELRRYAEEHPEKRWILGGRWDQEKCTEKRYPTRWDLDAIVKNRPVFLRRICGHIGVANSKALQLAGITSQAKVENGKVDLDEQTGEPNGILRENAMELIAKAIPEPTSQELENACVLACQEAVGAGLTGVHWLVDSAQEIRVLQKLHSERKLPLRVYLGIAVNLLDDLVNLGLCTGFGDDMVKVGFVKILADGSLGGHTASMKEPYSDKPETRGMMLYAQEELNKLASKANEAGLQLGIHAIGDHAIEAVTQTFEKALRKVPRKDHRHRIEHCSVLNPKLIKRMKNLELIASAQPHFIFSDFWVLDRVGKSRARWVYPLKTLVREGLVVASGSDCPVEPINPLFGVWAAVDRKDFPQENLSVEEALKTYTINAAYASFDEDKKGTIERGKFGDLTVLSDDLTSIPCDRIRDVKIEMVIVGGKIVHVRK